MAKPEVVDLLEKIERILAQYSVNDWLIRIQDCIQRLQVAISSNNTKSLLQELEYLKSFYGGMGSFSDIFITPEAGYKIEQHKVSPINRNFQKLQARLYDKLTEEIQKLQDI
jgi:hypothetical protein